MDRPLTRIRENRNPKDSDYILGASENSNLFQKTRIIDAITSRYNPNSGWRLLDGSNGDYQAIANERIFINQNSIQFSIILDSVVNFGDTIIVYPRIENVLLKRENSIIKQCQINQITHLLFTDSGWLDFSPIGNELLSLFPTTGEVIRNSYQRRLKGIYIQDFIGTGKGVSNR